MRASYIEGLLVRPVPVHRDARGWLAEVYRDDDLPGCHTPRMCYVSVTLPGVTRGPHEHKAQADWFVFPGPGEFRFDLWPHGTTTGPHTTLYVGESAPTAVRVPPGVVHAYTNVGTVPGLVINAPNQLYSGWQRKDAVDEIRYEDGEADA